MIYKKILTIYFFTLAVFSVAAGEEPAENTSLVPVEQGISDCEARRVLVEVLLRSPNTKKSGLKQMAAMLQQCPIDSKLRISLAKSYLLDKDYLKAFEQMKLLYQSQPLDNDTIMELAQIEAELGHYQKAKLLYEQILMQSDDPDISLKFAGLMQHWGDYEKAQAIYRKYKGRKTGSDERIDLYLASALAGAERFYEAESLYQRILCEEPSDTALLGLARVKFSLHDYCAALFYLERIENLSLEATHLYADTLEKLGQLKEALMVLLDAKQKFKNDLLGKARLFIRAHRIALKLEETSLAFELLEKAAELAPNLIAVHYYQRIASMPMDCLLEEILINTKQAQELVEWAHLFYEDNYVDVAIALYGDALANDPEHDAARITLAGALSTQMRYWEAADIYSFLSNRFLYSPLFHLQYARVLSWSKSYKAALQSYCEFIRCYPENPVARLERARVALWAQNGDLAMCYYQELLQDCVHPVVREAAKAEMATEWARWNKRPLAALCEYKEWIESFPGNQQALYGYSELLCEVGACCQANNIREVLAEDDPKNIILNMALDRENIELRPSLVGVYDYWHEVGYGTLSGIWRHQFHLGTDIPFGCSGKIRVTYDFLLDHTLINHDNFEAQAFTIRYENVINPCLSVFASLTQKVDADYSMHHPTQGFFRLEGRYSDCMKYDLGIAQKDEYYNYFGVVRGLQSTSYWVNATLMLSRRHSLETRLERMQFNDHNSQNLWSLSYNCQFTEYPRVLRGFILAQYRNTRDTNTYIYIDDTLVDIIHPYWAPQNYWAGRIGLEFQHDLQCISFCGAQKHYYILRAAGGDDTESNLGGNIGFEYHIDYNDMCSFYLNAMVYRSYLWNAEGVWTGCSYRF